MTTNYGFKLYMVGFYPPRKPAQAVPLDAEGWGEGGFLGALQRLIEDVIKDSQGRDDRKSTFTTFESFSAGGRLVLLRAGGGVFGQTADVVDTGSGAKTGTIKFTDAVLHSARCLFVVPPTGNIALLLAEAVGGRKASAPLVVNRMKSRLREMGAVARVEHDVADGHAWSSYLDSDQADVRAIELIQTGPTRDRTPIASNAGVKSARIIVSLKSGGAVKSMLKAIGGGASGRRRLALAPVVGLSQYDDDDFDEQRIVIIKDRRQQTINVTSGWPSFFYQIDTDIPPNDITFVYEAANAAQALLDDLDIHMPKKWRIIDLPAD